MSEERNRLREEERATPVLPWNGSRVIWIRSTSLARVRRWTFLVTNTCSDDLASRAPKNKHHSQTPHAERRVIAVWENWSTRPTLALVPTCKCMFFNPERRPLAELHGHFMLIACLEPPRICTPSLSIVVPMSYRATQSHCLFRMFSLLPSPVNERLPGIRGMNAVVASMLPNLACRCNFGLQLQCQTASVLS